MAEANKRRRRRRIDILCERVTEKKAILSGMYRISMSLRAMMYETDCLAWVKIKIKIQQNGFNGNKDVKMDERNIQV